MKKEFKEVDANSDGVITREGMASLQSGKKISPSHLLTSRGCPQHKGMGAKYSHWMVHNIHTNQGSKRNSVPTYTLVVHNLALY